MSAKPNVLLIMADQLTPFMMGAYGNNQVFTPNLDGLVENGIRFDEAYTPCPLCTPARASMMTGRYISELGCYDNASPFSCAEPTFVHYLSCHGYDTALSGKMHFIGPDQLHGFKTRLTTDIYPSGFDWVPRFIDSENHIMQGDNWGNAKNYISASIGTQSWNMHIQYDEETQFRAKEYLYSRAKSMNDPFFLCVSYHHPHDPFHPPGEFWDMYEEVEIDIPDLSENDTEKYTVLDKWLNNGFHRNDIFDIRDPEGLYKLRRAYSALVTYIDHKVGELMDILKETGLDKNTIVIFTSDHGDMLGEKGMVQKRCFYEWSSKIPLIIRYPNNLYANKKIKSPVSLIDLGPSILEMVSEERHKEFDIDGKSFVDIIQGKENLAREVISESHGEGIVWPCFMIRSGRFKYTYIHQYESQLFDVEKDPKENNNLSGKPEYSQIETQLKNKILKRFAPDKILADMNESIKKRQLIKEAMTVNNSYWDYSPFFDASKQYVRSKKTSKQ